MSSRWQSALEHFPPGWNFPAGNSWVAGWLHGGVHHHVDDVRAWVDGRVFLGLHGLPRPGVDERLLQRSGPPYAGFSFLLRPHRGARLLRLEVRDANGTWTEFFRTPIAVEENAAPWTPPPPLVPRLTDALLALLRQQARNPTVAISALACDIVIAATATPLNALPPPPLYGALEGPTDAGWLRYGRLEVHGWLAHRTARIARITAMVDATQEVTLLHGLPRAGIEAVFGDLPGTEHAQFVGRVDLPGDALWPVLLKVFVELDNGEKHLAFAQRFQPRVIAGEEGALPPLSRRRLAQSVWALHRAAKRLGVPWGGVRAGWPAVRETWSAWRSMAPAREARARNDRPIPQLAGDTRPLRLLIAAHNLNFEGAPWFIFELARFFAAQPGVSVRVVSGVDGPLRQVFEDAGMPVQILDLGGAFAARHPDEFHRALADVGSEIDWGSVDLVIANTMVAFWGVHLASAAGCPALLYVHESSPVRRFFEPLVPSRLFPVVEEAFRRASRVIFTADSTRRVHAHLGDRGNFLLLPSWVDLARIDAFAASHDRTALRRKHGFEPDATLLVNIGSLCERKGQHVFLRAIQLLREELKFTYPGHSIHFIMVGARPGTYLETLRAEVRAHGLDHVHFIAETGTIFDFYRMADILVCTSFEESFPRVLLEAAAFRLPIVSTNVNGIAEMLSPDEAWLVPPGDRDQLAEAMKQALASHLAGDAARATRARSSVAARFDETRVLPLHFSIAQSSAVNRRR